MTAGFTHRKFTELKSYSSHGPCNYPTLYIYTRKESDHQKGDRKGYGSKGRPGYNRWGHTTERFLTFCVDTKGLFVE